jgi:hypothetical protein
MDGTRRDEVRNAPGAAGGDEDNGHADFDTALYQV